MRVKFLCHTSGFCELRLCVVLTTNLIYQAAWGCSCQSSDHWLRGSLHQHKQHQTSSNSFSFFSRQQGLRFSWIFPSQSRYIQIQRFPAAGCPQSYSNPRKLPGPAKGRPKRFGHPLTAYLDGERYTYLGPIVSNSGNFWMYLVGGEIITYHNN